MCGICGNISLHYPVNRDEVLRMAAAIVHRGPDDEGMYVSPDSQAALGFRRLSIIDLSTGHQPLSNEDGTIWISFNGEIYDFQNIRERLLKAGHRFTTKTDTEVIVHLYEDRGKDVVSELRGMFAFAIWDERKQSLFAARDRVGKKPFYYTVRDGRFYYASELKCLMAVANELPSIDLDALDQYLAFGYIPAPRTIYQGISKLPPGHWLRYSSAGLEIERYWTLEFDPDPSRDETTLLDEVEAQLREAVRLRLISDVPLGALLSGGVDSSVIVALMAQEGGAPPKTFSVGFDESDFSELSHARKVAKFIGTDHHEQVVKPDIVPGITELVHHYDEPFADSSMLPTHLVCRHARQHLTVALSGDGGDEVFGGYPRYLYESWISKWLRIPGTRLAAKALSAVYPRQWRGYLQLQKMRYEDGSRYAEQVSILHSSLRRALYSGLGGADGAEAFIQAHYKNTHGRPHETLSRLQQVDILQGWLPGDMLTKVDMASMKTSLEIRCPLLDHKLIEYMARVPARFKIRGRTTKYLLKKIGERLVPPEILYRPKQGFSLPLTHWFRQNLREYAQSMLLGPESRVSGVFQREPILQLFDEHIRLGLDNSGKIFTLLALEIWLRSKTANPQQACEWVTGSRQLALCASR